MAGTNLLLYLLCGLPYTVESNNVKMVYFGEATLEL